MSYISEFNETVMDISELVVDNLQANTATITSASIPTLVSNSITTTVVQANSASIISLISTSASITSASVPTLTSTSATVTSASIGTFTSTTATITSASIPTLTGTDATFESITIGTTQPFIDVGSVQYTGWNQFDVKEGTSTGNRIRHYVNVNGTLNNAYKITALYDSDISAPSATDIILGFGSHSYTIPTPTRKPFITGLKGDCTGYGELRLNPNIDGTPGKISIGFPFSRSATYQLEVAGSIFSDNTLYGASTVISGSMSAVSATLTSASIPTLTSTSATLTSASIPTLTSTNATITTATVPTLNSTTLNAASLTATNASVNNLTCTSLTLSSAAFPSLTATNAIITTGSIGTLTSTSSTITTGSISTLTSTSATLTTATITNATCSNFKLGNSTVVSSATIATSYTIPALATSSFVMTEGAQTINGLKTIATGVITSLSAPTLTTTSATITSATIPTLVSTSATLTTSIITNATCSNLKVGNSTVVSSATTATSYTIPALATSSFIMSEGAQTVNGSKTFSASTIFNGGITSTNTTVPIGKSLVITPNASAIAGIDMTLNASSLYGVRITGSGGNANPFASFAQATANASQNFIQMQNGTFSSFIRTQSMAGPRNYTLPDAGADADFILSQGTQTLSGVKTFASNPVMSSLTASQAVVTDASKNLASVAYTSANIASTIVQRDASNNFSAGAITLTGGVVLSSTSSLMNYFFENDYVIDFGGIWSGKKAITVRVQRIGVVIHIRLSEILSAGSTAGVILGDSALNALFRPPTTVWWPVQIIDNSLGYYGILTVTSSGIMNIGLGPTQTNWPTGTGTCGWYQINAHWTT